MAAPAPSTPVTPAGRSLVGGTLLLARAVWVALAAVQLLSYAILLPGYLTLPDHPCADDCALTVQRVQALTAAGISPRVYLAVLLSVSLFSVAVASIMAFALFVRRSREWMVLIAAYVVLILPTSSILNLGPVPTGASQTTAFAPPLPVDLALAGVQTAAIYGLFLLFPSGRFVPRWTWLLLAGFLVYTACFVLLPDWQTALVGGWALFFGAAIANIVHRYRRVSSAVERQQTKWVIAGFVAFLLASQAYWLPLFTPLSATVYAPLAYLVYEFALPVVPITFFLAIQRHRLYDIDSIIRRTLVYGLLSAILAAIYAVGVLGTHLALQRLSGARITESQPALVVTTLLIAALFLPLRRRIQELIDRRFYRRRYDTGQTLARFATALRSAVDLDRLTDDLTSVVDETMEPAHISLWLRPRDTPAR